MSSHDYLSDPETSLLIIQRRNASDIVVGAPHHAPLGVETLPCEEHEDSDENAGVVARCLASILDCHNVIASNYVFDSNKCKRTDYHLVIERWQPTLFVEVHGHGGSAKTDVEISSGSSANNKWSKSLARRLEERFGQIPVLEKYTVSGDFENIKFQATKSKTITSEHWLAFHIEIPKAIRSSEERYQPFCEALATELVDILEELRKV